MEPLPRVFDILQHFETILPLVESLYGWWRCWRPVTSPTMVAILAAFLEEIRLKLREMVIFLALLEE